MERDSLRERGVYYNNRYKKNRNLIAYEGFDVYGQMTILPLPYNTRISKDKHKRPTLFNDG